MNDSGIINPILINRFNLKFNNKLFEESFKENYYRTFLIIHRFAILLAIILYALFAYLDVWMSPNSKEKIWIIRFGIVLPILIFAFVSTIFSHIQKSESTYICIHKYFTWAWNHNNDWYRKRK
ncbi:MAG: hypothetical protein KBF93_03750 [Leptospiraceae bacterium]|nr:hypothetical protein [Leptospiraceae bacterium]